MRSSGVRVVLLLIATGLSAPATSGAQTRHPPTLPDPARNLVRVEVRITTDARFASVRVGDATPGAATPSGPMLAVAQGRRLAGPGDLRTAVLENLLALSSNIEGQSATATYRLVLTQVAPGSSVSWRLNVQGAHRASLDVYNMNNEQQPRLVDHFDGAIGATFSSSGDQLRIGGPLPQPAAPEARLVLGHYYPWYERATWTDPQMLDQPLRLYSTEDAADLLQEMKDAQHAGLDGVIVSWQGRDIGGGWNHRRTLLVLQAAQQLGMKVSTQIETFATYRPGADGSSSPDINLLVQWLDDIVDLYGAQQAYLRVAGRPVIFLYAWNAPGDAVWRQAIDRVRASGRNLCVLADTPDVSSQALADGEFTYGDTIFADDVAAFTTRLALGARTYHLLGADRGPRRLGLATVSPGFDDRKLRDRTQPHVISRENGDFYDRQWRAAAASGADWVLVTTWNEWWENTEVEAGQLYGDAYRWKTAFWAAVFKKSPRQ